MRREGDETLGVYSGEVTVQFGGDGGIVVTARPGDVIVLPAPSTPVEIETLRAQHPGIRVIVHPEVPWDVVQAADRIRERHPTLPVLLRGGALAVAPAAPRASSP